MFSCTLIVGLQLTSTATELKPYPLKFKTTYEATPSDPRYPCTTVSERLGATAPWVMSRPGIYAWDEALVYCTSTTQREQSCFRHLERFAVRF